MISILLTLLLLLPCLLGLGKLFSVMIKKSIFDGIANLALMGIFSVSIVWTILAFFVPLNFYVEIPTLLLGIFFFVKYKMYSLFTKFTRKDLIIITLITFAILYCGSFPPYILDHFGYYVPSIQWLTEYGLVKGISNLDIVLGQMTVWHIFQAGFSNFSDPFLRINVLLLLIYLLYIVEKKNWIQFCLLPILFLFSQSPSPDLPVIIFSLILLNEILKGNKNASSLFAYSVFVFIIKPTMIWLPILSFLYFIFIIKMKLKGLVFGICLLLLFIIKNIWTFGYPIFPVSILDLGVSWKPNSELMKSSSQFAIMKTYDMQYSHEEIMQFSGLDYIKNWLFLSGIKSVINILFVITLLAFMIFTLIKKNKIITFIYISIIIKSLLVLSFSAQYRFFIDVFFVAFFVMMYPFFTRKRSLYFFTVFSFVVISYITLPMLVGQYVSSYRMSAFMGKFTFKQMYKPTSYTYNKYKTYRVGNLTFHVSDHYSFNFDTPTPAISDSFILDYQAAGIFPQLIDEKDIRKGFVWKKMNKQEVLEVEKIITKIKESYKE
ncbi:LIC_10190 family membrane protein [Chryseobacterium sp.]|uniref:LIC_10190 family membrane protein n=1 Tax=Chryseobacterium sp. TaxID=1871047 RepID=UPI00388D5598